MRVFPDRWRIALLLVSYLVLVFLMEIDRGRLQGMLTPYVLGWADEDGPLEISTAILAAMAAVGCFVLLARLRTRLGFQTLLQFLPTALILLFLVFWAGEEISWGQRILGFDTPSVFSQRSTQDEPTLHNVKGINEYVNGVFIIGLFLWGIFLPIANRFSSAVRKLRLSLSLPLPPLWSIWFFVAAISYRVLYFNKTLYRGDGQEGLEFLTALAILVVVLHGISRPRGLFE